MLIGIGDVGMGYDLDKANKYVLTHARAVHQHKSFELICAVDPDETKRRVFEKTYKCIAYKDFSEVENPDKADFCIVSCPTEFHFTLLKQVIHSCQPKVILCEKPFTSKEAEAEEIVALCKKENIELFINYFRRFDSSTSSIKKIIDDSGDESITINIFYPKGFLHNGSHFFNLIEFWLGKCVIDSSLTEISKSEEIILTQFEKGVGIFHKLKNENDPCSMDINGTFGKIRYENNGENIYLHRRIKSKTFPKEYIISHVPEEINNDYLKYQLRVLEMINEDGQSRLNCCFGSEGFQTLKSIKSILRRVGE